MGYATAAVLAHFERMEGLYASRDDSVLRRMREPEQRFARSLMGGTERKVERMQAAVLDILRGSAFYYLDAHEYAFALEAMAFELGTPLPLEVDSRDEQRARTLVSSIDPGEELLLGVLSNAWFAPIPPPEAYPFVGYILRPKCAAWAARLSGYLEATAGVEGEDADRGREALRTIEGWCSEAVRQEADLFLFQH